MKSELAEICYLLSGYGTDPKFDILEAKRNEKGNWVLEVCLARDLDPQTEKEEQDAD